jgi:hypothetical protein
MEGDQEQEQIDVVYLIGARTRSELDLPRSDLTGDGGDYGFGLGFLVAVVNCDGGGG